MKKLLGLKGFIVFLPSAILTFRPIPYGHDVTLTLTWDANGNLLNDGVNTYTYDPANRLATVSGASSVSYIYNGLGDRLQQTIGSNTTTYVMDLNMGLTQVLDDGANTYLYGNGRIAQSSIENPQSEIAYFPGDALGSVRQMTTSLIFCGTPARRRPGYRES